MNSGYGGRTAPKRCAALLLVVLATVVSSCGTSQAPPPVSTSSVAQPTSSSSSNATLDVVPTIQARAPLPRGDDLELGPGTVYTGCTGTFEEGQPLGFPDGQYFNPATGLNMPLPKPSIPSGKMLVRGACTVGGDVKHVRIVYAYTLLTPSSGLTPESRESLLTAFGPADDPSLPMGAGVTAKWPADIDIAQVDALAPTDYGLMAWKRGEVAVGFDPITLAKVWQDSGEIAAVNFAGYARFDRAPGEAVGVITSTPHQTVFCSGRDGTELGADTDAEIKAVLPRGFLMEGPDAVRGSADGYFDMQTPRLTRPISAPRGGSAVQVWGDEILWGGPDFALTVWDSKENKNLLALTASEAQGLNVERAVLAGNYLYIANKSDSPVIDLRSHQKVSSGSNLRPTDVINSEWTLLDNIPNELLGNCFRTVTSVDGDDFGEYTCKDAQNLKLAHTPNGLYSGPWF